VAVYRQAETCCELRAKVCCELRAKVREQPSALSYFHRGEAPTARPVFGQLGKPWSRYGFIMVRKYTCIDFYEVKAVTKTVKLIIN
jgi:hypothetical protein